MRDVTAAGQHAQLVRRLRAPRPAAHLAGRAQDAERRYAAAVERMGRHGFRVPSPVAALGPAITAATARPRRSGGAGTAPPSAAGTRAVRAMPQTGAKGGSKAVTRLPVVKAAKPVRNRVLCGQRVGSA
ncbi:hypothetical protein GCM10010347_47030 [Streptomyces cirratus]|uniref:Uncharacterized protein n=1 Tax=Streptomyces cirratus TaxID=68187 RepID=A0ABQ3F3L3_9ACTN|nr:hypothetical protein GCM10010347_47030 [Streptomyces cirratus]